MLYQTIVTKKNIDVDASFVGVAAQIIILALYDFRDNCNEVILFRIQELCDRAQGL